jgi:hypothetical protein
VTGPAGGLIVPLYVHPVLAEGTWRRVRRVDLGEGFVVVNVADGPGAEPDEVYATALDEVRSAGVPVVGYLDCAYGRRRGGELLDDAKRWQDLYSVDAVFVDQVPSGAETTPATGTLIERLRAGGAGRVVLNPGLVPAPGIAGLGDLVVCFEGRYADFNAYQTPEWLREQPAHRVAHLVHGVPQGTSFARVREESAAAGARFTGVSRASLPNPWDGSSLAELAPRACRGVSHT